MEIFFFLFLEIMTISFHCFFPLTFKRPKGYVAVVVIMVYVNFFVSFFCL
jgi:hypothetical protein